MKTLKGPGLFLAQFVGDKPPFNDLYTIAKWPQTLAIKACRFRPRQSFRSGSGATSKDYCDELKGKLAEIGVEITELSTHIQGQLVAVHPAYDALFDAFAPEAVRGNPKARQEWGS